MVLIWVKQESDPADRVEAWDPSKMTGQRARSISIWLESIEVKHLIPRIQQHND